MTRDGSEALTPGSAAAPAAIAEPTPVAAPGVSTAPSRTPASKPATPASPTWGAGAAVAVALTVALTSVLLCEQGGYYASDSAVIAIIICVIAVAGFLRNRMRLAVSSFIPMLLLGGVCAVGVASAVSHGLSYVALSSLAPWLVFAAAVCAAGTLRPEERRAAVTALAWVGVAASAIGILMYAGVVSFDGGIASSDGKLNFYFQYAATSGSFFCAMGLLAIGSSSTRLRWAAFPALAALTLTLSGGAAIVALASFGVLAAIWAWRLDFRRFAALVVQALLALAFCVAAFKGPSGWTLPAAALGVCVCALCGIVEWRLESRGRLAPPSEMSPRPRLLLRVVLVVAVAVAVAAVVACALALFGSRVGVDVGNLMERLAYMRDAIYLWTTNPLLGVGPGRWQFEYRFVESASYWTKYVHCGYLHLACELGTFALLFFISALVLLFSGLVRRLRTSRFDDGARNECLAVIVAVAALLAHAAIDWDFAFGEILLVLAILITPPSPAYVTPPPVVSPLSSEGDLQSGAPQPADELSDEGDVPSGSPEPENTPPDEGDPRSAAPSRRVGVAGLLRGSLAAVLAVFVLVVSYASYDAYETRDAILDDASTGDALAVLETVEADPLALADEEIETQVLNALVRAGRCEEGIDFVEACGGHSGNAQSVSLAACLYGVDRASDAEEVLLDAMWAEPRTRILFSQVVELFEMHGLSEENEDEYHEVVAYANSLLTQGMNPLTNKSTAPMSEYTG